MGKGETEAPGGGEGGLIFYLKSQEGGGVLSEGKGPRGREGVCGKLGIFGGGAKYFFFGAEMSTKIARLQLQQQNKFSSKFNFACASASHGTKA